MSYCLSIRSAAEADIEEAAQWYDDRQSRLCEPFVDEVDRALAGALENPLGFPNHLSALR
ncbi:MAG: hypothetical protein JO015_05795 [Verrucomicrobia bacterium]|nr:hypothetical protein [Verrucomicrobiota bacterium]